MTYYDDLASGYGELYHDEQLKKIALIKQYTLFVPTAKVLDVGCGPGYFADVVSCPVVGLDPSFELLKKASCLKVRGKAEFLPFKKHSFNVVVSLTALHHFTDLSKALAEMKAVAQTQWIITILKKARKKTEIIARIGSVFHIEKKVDEGKDIILFCH